MICDHRVKWEDFLAKKSHLYKMKVSTLQVWAQNIVLKKFILFCQRPESERQDTMLTREILFLEKYQLYKHIQFCFSDILANRDEGNQSNSQTQRDPIHKAIGE